MSAINSKRFRFVLLGTLLTAVVIFGIALQPKAQANNPTSYKLICRGNSSGYPTVAIDAHKGSFRGLPWSKIDVKYYFNRGTARASSGTIPIGQCRWTDRAFRSHEPGTLCHEVNSVDSRFQKTPSANNVYQFSSPDLPYLYVNNGNSSGSLLDNNAYWTLMVYNDTNNNCLRVTRVVGRGIR